jgi:hypothetical protein
LKYFSLTSFDPTYKYDELIVPLLRRMINLEELKLYLSVIRYNSNYIDGFELYDQILIYMTRLNKFTFNIDTRVFNKNVTFELLSNEDIQRSFIERGYQQVASYVHKKSFTSDSKCHIYSLPYDFEYFVNLDNSFQGGMFHKVRYSKMGDIHAFEHKLFQLISQDLPFLEFLYICNAHRQKYKQHSSTLITFPHLTLLDLQCTHVDYAEQFLLKKNVHLPRLLNLCIEYKSLAKITNNFTNNTERFNFSKLKCLDLCQPFVPPENFHQYFPFYKLFQ